MPSMPKMPSMFKKKTSETFDQSDPSEPSEISETSVNRKNIYLILLLIIPLLYHTLLLYISIKISTNNNEDKTNNQIDYRILMIIMNVVSILLYLITLILYYIYSHSLTYIIACVFSVFTWGLSIQFFDYSKTLTDTNDKTIAENMKQYNYIYTILLFLNICAFMYIF
jgi:uncharacterized Tic20 family protein